MCTNNFRGSCRYHTISSCGLHRRKQWTQPAMQVSHPWKAEASPCSVPPSTPTARSPGWCRPALPKASHARDVARNKQAPGLLAAAWSAEGHNLMTVPKLRGTEAALCISKRTACLSSTSSLPLPPHPRLRGFCALAHRGPCLTEFIQPNSSSDPRPKKMRLLWLQNVVKAEWSWARCVLCLLQLLLQATPRFVFKQNKRSDRSSAHPYENFSAIPPHCNWTMGRHLLQELLWGVAVKGRRAWGVGDPLAPVLLCTATCCQQA